MQVTKNSPRTADSQQAFAAAVEAAKLQAAYNLAYGLSHEINNPLANIAMRAQTLIAGEKDALRRRKLKQINQQAFRAHEMIADLMFFARPPQPRLEPTDLVALADHVVAEMQVQAAEQETLLVRLGAEGPLTASVDPAQIAMALTALIQNSLEAVRKGGHVEVILDFGFSILDSDQTGQKLKIDAAHSAPPPRNPKSKIQNLKLSVTDSGPGIPPDVRPHIFDPFFSGREAGRGLGLGLSKAWRIVEQHGGTIEVASPARGGATFTMNLPMASQ